jgi:hypothetical protein
MFTSTFYMITARRSGSFSTRRTCPSCKHDFSDMLFLDIASALQHEVVDGVAQWSEAATSARRLGALQALIHLPQEQPLGLSIARAIVLSLADADQGIVCAAARSISHWANALYIFMQEPAFCRLLCETSVAALRSAASDDTKAVISTAISDLVLNEDGRRALVAADACQAVADALRSAASLKLTFSIVISHLAGDEDSRRAVVVADACRAVAGGFVKFKPLQTEFMRCHNPKAILMVNLRCFAALTMGMVITIFYGNPPKQKRFDLEVPAPLYVVFGHAR